MERGEGRGREGDVFFWLGVCSQVLGLFHSLFGIEWGVSIKRRKGFCLSKVNLSN